MTWINRLYILFLGIILSVTTGFGLAAFYPQPTAPSYFMNKPMSLSCSATPQSQDTPECRKELQQQQEQELQQQKAQEMYTNKSAGYTRTAVFFGIVIGGIFAIAGIGMIKTSKLVANGLLLGGLVTAILTRVLINLASLGSSATGTDSADTTAYVEFAVLFILSIVIVWVGLYRLNDANAISAVKKAKKRIVN